MIKVFLGYDPRESVAWHVAAHSIMRHASVPVSVTPLVLSQLPLTRPKEGSTEFSFSRFMVPWLCNYEGLAIFMDCDVLLRADIRQLLDQASYSMTVRKDAVAVVKHQYTPKSDVKMDGQRQLPYDRKNWSSVMVFDCWRCKALTPHVVNTMPGLWLHQFRWLHDDEIGELPAEWNVLIGEQIPDDPKLLHFTLGIPTMPGYEDCEFSGEWRDEARRARGF